MRRRTRWEEKKCCCCFHFEFVLETIKEELRRRRDDAVMDWTAVDNGLIDWGGDGGDLDH